MVAAGASPREKDHQRRFPKFTTSNTITKAAGGKEYRLKNFHVENPNYERVDIREKESVDQEQERIPQEHRAN